MRPSISLLNRWFAVLVACFAVAVQAAENHIETVLQPSKSPLVVFRIWLKTGSVFDPAGKEGLASLTASLLAKGGSAALSYDQIIQAMYPMATSFDAQVDKEMTVFSGVTHVENLDKYYDLIRQMLMEPGFRQEDFDRLKSDATNYLKVSLREGNDEELGKEELYNLIYGKHPYGFHSVGKLSSLEKLTLTDVKAFYAQEFNRKNVVIGLAGGYPDSFVEKISKDFARLPKGKAGKVAKVKLPAPKLAAGREIEIIQRDTRATAISFGIPIKVKRGDPDWAALTVASAYLGQHRSSVGRLYQRLRETRGLNYGDYAYTEYFPRGMYQFQPDPNLARQQQIFQVWVRPVEPKNGQFALRAALYETEKMIREGISRENFEATREFLGKYANILLQTQDARLGYALDSKFYGIGEFGGHLQGELAKLTVEEVNRAIRKNLNLRDLRIVMITKDAEGLKQAIEKGLPSMMTYNSPKPPEVMAEDKEIEIYPVHSRSVNIVPVTDIFR